MNNYANYEVHSFKSSSSLSSHRSNLSSQSIQSQKTSFDKFGNPIYSASLNTPLRNDKYYQNNKNNTPYYSKRSLSQDEYNGHFAKQNNIDDYNNRTPSPSFFTESAASRFAI